MAYKINSNGQINVPSHIKAIVPDGASFEPELTEDGILYRIVQSTTPAGLPSWAKSDGDR
jgi:hypothetical protein